MNKHTFLLCKEMDERYVFFLQEYQIVEHYCQQNYSGNFQHSLLFLNDFRQLIYILDLNLNLHSIHLNLNFTDAMRDSTHFLFTVGRQERTIGKF